MLEYARKNGETAPTTASLLERKRAARAADERQPRLESYRAPRSSR